MATGNFSLLGCDHVSHRTERGGDGQTCARGSCGDTTEGGARPAAARHVGRLARPVCGGWTRPLSILSGVNMQGARGHLQVQESSSQEPGPGSRAAGGVQCRSAGQAARRGASRRFAVLCCGWMRHGVVTPSQLTLNTGGDLAPGSSTPRHEWSQARHQHQRLLTTLGAAQQSRAERSGKVRCQVADQM